MRPLVVTGLLAALLAAAAAPPAFAAGSTETAPAPSRPRNPDFDAGKAAVNRGDFAGAIPLLRKATQVDARNPEAFNLLGYATRKSGDARGSLASYQQALALDPKHLGAHEYIGEAYLMLDDIASAQQHLARLDQLCVFGCREHRMLKDAIAAYQRGQKPR